MPTLAVGMRSARKHRNMPTTSQGMARVNYHLQDHQSIRVCVTQPTPCARLVP